MTMASHTNRSTIVIQHMQNGKRKPDLTKNCEHIAWIASYHEPINDIVNSLYEAYMSPGEPADGLGQLKGHRINNRLQR